MFIISGQIINKPTPVYRVQFSLKPDKEIEMVQQSNPQLMTRESRLRVADALTKIATDMRMNIFGSANGDFKEPCPK